MNIKGNKLFYILVLTFLGHLSAWALDAPVISASGPTTICEGGSVVLSSTAITGVTY